jgi:hypothetical protein
MILVEIVERLNKMEHDALMDDLGSYPRGHCRVLEQHIVNGSGEFVSYPQAGMYMRLENSYEFRIRVQMTDEAAQKFKALRDPT